MSSRYWDNRRASVLASEGKDKLGSRKNHRGNIEGSFCVKCGAWKGQLGLEPTPFLYVEHMVMIFREIKRVLKKTGSVYVVLGDTYAGSCSQGSQSKSQPYLRLYPQRKALQPKCLIGIPWRVALALIDDGWILRNAIVWHKPNAMPSSVKDRLTCTYETIFHFVKNRKYYYDLDAIREPHSTGTFKRILQKNVFQQSGGDKQIQLRGKKKSSGDRGSRCADMAKSIAEKYVKHDLAVGRVGNVRYTDPLHTKKYYLSGKNPGDVIKAKWSNVSGQLTQGNFGHGGTHGNRFNHPLGKNPRDIISSRYPPHEPRHFQLLKMGIPHGGHTGKTVRHDNPLGRNPGDVIVMQNAPHRDGRDRKDSVKFAEEQWQWFRGKHNDNPLCKNPGDVFHSQKKPYISNNPHRMRLQRKKYIALNSARPMDLSHPKGKNPGDVIRIGMHHGSSSTSGRATHHEGQIIEKHLLGKNPGDVMHFDREKTAVEDFRTRSSMRLPPEPQNPNAFHPKGKNPGDIVKTRRDSSEIMAQSGIHRYHSRTGVHQEGINLGRYRYAKGGKNPGDVMKQAEEMTKKHPTYPPHHAPRIRLSDWNPHEWVQHPLGKNPGDIILEKGIKAGKANAKDSKLNDVRPDCEGKVLDPRVSDDADPSDFWSITTKPFKGQHFAVYPEEICIKPIKSSCPPDGIVLDLMCGSGTTLVAAKKLGRKYIGFDINPNYVEMARKRLREVSIK